MQHGQARGLADPDQQDRYSEDRGDDGTVEYHSVIVSTGRRQKSR